MTKLIAGWPNQLIHKRTKWKFVEPENNKFYKNTCSLSYNGKHRTTWVENMGNYQKKCV